MFNILTLIISQKINCSYVWINARDNNDNNPDNIPVKLCGVKKETHLNNKYSENNVYQIINMNALGDVCTYNQSNLKKLNVSHVTLVSLKENVICNYTQLVNYNTNDFTTAIVFSLNGPFDVSATTNVTSIFVRTDMASQLNVNK